MSNVSVERAHAQIVEAVSERLCTRSASAFRRVGKATCHKHIDAALVALQQDLASGKHEAVRKVVYTLIEELTVEGLTFSDLRFYAQSLRTHVRDAIDADPRAQLGEQRDHPQIEDWFFELTMVCTMRFMAWRDEKLQRETAQLGVQRLESQLTELKIALDEKTSLLELIRQASTPIAPVVRGIIVVPLVGTFDTFRAELLTEKLLQEIVRLRARAAILDISGVPVFDTEAAHLTIRLARAVRLLGTAVILVGMSPVNARTIVDLGVDMTGIETLATLQDGLALALKLQRMKIVSV